MSDAPILLWFRRDLRLRDNQMLNEAASSGRPVVPVFVRDGVVEAAPIAPRWRWGLGVDMFMEALDGIGSRLVLRSGAAGDALLALARDVGAKDVWWARHYDPAFVSRDEAAEDTLKAAGFGTRTFGGWVLREPWEVRTGAGGHYKVFTPYWRAVAGIEVGAALDAPRSLRPPEVWPDSEDLASWRMGAAMDRGAEVVSRHVHVGEVAARDRLDRFVDERLTSYDTTRDRPGTLGTSGLSENLTYGEISPRTVWHAALEGRSLTGLDAGRATFLKELVWRDYSHHLLYHTPHLAQRNWKAEWDAFPWRDDNADAEAWRRGRTGIPFVDAAMREMWVTGTMHNRGRLIAASYLTKHLLTHWRVGCDFFADHLIDWDVANNAVNWQWVAGSGPDASPFFRVFNPESQEGRFDPKGAYARRWIAERGKTDERAASFFDAVPRSWGLSPAQPYPDPIVPPSAGRERALDALRVFKERRTGS